MENTNLEFKSIYENVNLVPKQLFSFLEKNFTKEEKVQIKVAEINPDFANGLDLCEKYNIAPEIGANCLIVKGIRGDNFSYAALLVPVGYKYDMNGVVRKKLNARMVSVAPLDFVLEKTNMEYGSITPIGLPTDWQIFIDPKVLVNENIIIGGGLKKSKISIPSKLLLKLPNSCVLENLAK